MKGKAVDDRARGRVREYLVYLCKYPLFLSDYDDCRPTHGASLPLELIFNIIEIVDDQPTLAALSVENIVTIILALRSKFQPSSPDCCFHV